MMTTILQYAKDHYPPTKVDSITEAFRLFKEFNLVGYVDDFIELLMQQSYMTPDDISDSYLALIINKQHYVIAQHQIVVNNDTDMDVLNKIVNGLLVLGDLHEVTGTLYLLESDMDGRDKLVSILTDLTDLDDSVLYESIESVRDMFISTLQEQLYLKDRTLKQIAKVAIDVSKAKAFRDFIGNDDYLAIAVSDMSIPLYQPIEYYVPTVASLLNDKPANEVAKHLYSLLMVTDRRNTAPLLQYKEASHLFFNDLNVISEILLEMSKIDIAFTKYMVDKNNG